MWDVWVVVVVYMTVWLWTLLIYLLFSLQLPSLALCKTLSTFYCTFDLRDKFSGFL